MSQLIHTTPLRTSIERWIERMEAEKCGRIEKRTVYARIALAIDRNGKWSACGWSGASDGDMMDGVGDELEPGEKRYFVTVPVMLPDVFEVEEIEGQAIEAGEGLEGETK